MQIKAYHTFILWVITPGKNYNISGLANNAEKNIFHYLDLIKDDITLNKIWLTSFIILFPYIIQ